MHSCQQENLYGDRKHPRTQETYMHCKMATLHVLCCFEPLISLGLFTNG